MEQIHCCLSIISDSAICSMNHAQKSTPTVLRFSESFCFLKLWFNSALNILFRMLEALFTDHHLTWLLARQSIYVLIFSWTKLFMTDIFLYTLLVICDKSFVSHSEMTTVIPRTLVEFSISHEPTPDQNLMNWCPAQWSIFILCACVFYTQIKFWLKTFLFCRRPS